MTKKADTYYAVCNKDRTRWVGRNCVVTSLRNAFWYDDHDKANSQGGYLWPGVSRRDLCRLLHCHSKQTVWPRCDACHIDIQVTFS